MDDDFDPYRQWLGVDSPERPPNHYALLGLKDYEANAERISEAVERQTKRVQEFQAKSPGNSAEKLLKEISAAGACLLDPRERSGYNALLRGAKSRLGPSADTSSSAGQLARDAAAYLFLRAKRIWILKARLAAAYRRLGRDVHEEKRLLEDLQPWHRRVDILDDKLADLADQRGRIRDEAGQKPGFLQGTKRLAGRALLLIREKWTEAHKRRMLRKLGRAAYDEGGIAAGPELLTVPIAALRSDLESVDKRLRRLSAVAEDQWISPKRLAWALVACVVTLLLLLGWWMRR